MRREHLVPFKIDLHVHTRHSGDNSADPEDMVQEALARGLDGIAFTEHYSYGASEYAERLREKYAGSIRILRGVEFSAAEGHCLVFGVDTDGLSIKGAFLGELVAAVNERGGAAVPSHPYRGGSGAGETVKTLAGIAALEGYNGANPHHMNLRAIEAARSLGLPFIGGSDAHASSEVGSCYTEFADEVTEENFLDALRSGRYAGCDVRKVSRWSWLPGR
ncbi:MAG: PHP domain-containing protein [Nitrospirota bacterium]